MGVATIYNQTQDAVLPGSTNSTISCLLAVMQASLKTTLVTTSALFSAWLGASQPIADNSAAARCCNLLQLAHANETFLPNSPGYTNSINSYWSLQARTNPTCIVTPSSALEVSAVTTTLVNSTCPFAIRSGGHNPFPDNNIPAPGITIDLSRLSSVTINPSAYSNNGRVAAIGPGARWKNVYDTLSPEGVAVPGGRAASVGVGGLTLGGGNSFFSARYGFVCDNVENFEVVLASGQIVSANSKENSDLWTALKGGSSNFGIVTRIDLTVFDLPKGEIWGGVVIYPNTTIPDQITAFVDFNDNIEKDPAASLITFWAYSSAAGMTVVQNCYEYTDPKINALEAPIFKNLLAIQPQVPNTNTLRTANLSSLTNELEAKYDLRDLFSTLSFNNDADIIRQVYALSEKLLEPLKQTKGLNWVTMFQPLPTIFSKHSVERGGNVMGLDRAKGNQVLFLFFVQWEDAADDVVLNKAAETLMQQVTDLTKKAGKANDWIYLNYALESQDPLSAYGPENVEKLRAASKKYDPNGVFQKLVPGGFKISAVGQQQQGKQGVETNSVTPARRARKL